MRKEEFCEILGEIDEKHVAQARTERRVRKPDWSKWSTTAARLKPDWHKWGAVAACLCLVAGLAIPLLTYEPPNKSDGVGGKQNTPGSTRPPENSSAPSIVVEGRKFLISPSQATVDQLPDGFVYAGNIQTSGGFDGPYYVDPDVPEWVYVYHEVWRNGVSAGTVYVRYVDERLRGRDLVCYDGNYYVSLWSVTYHGEYPDVTEDRYRQMFGQYGKRIEELPDGFEFVGKTEFSGDDTVPTGHLSHNGAETAVYNHPDDPSVILLETHWFTWTAEETEETRHDGYNVYILYDCPFAEKTEN